MPSTLRLLSLSSLFVWLSGCGGSLRAPNGRIRTEGIWIEERDRPKVVLNTVLPKHLVMNASSGSLVGVRVPNKPSDSIGEVRELPSTGKRYARSEGRIFSRIQNDAPWRSIFSEPVRDWFITLPSDAILTSGNYERLDINGEPTQFQGPFTSVVHRCESEACLTMRAMGNLCLLDERTKSATCYAEVQGQTKPTLRAEGSFGPVSRVEWEALRSMPVGLLAAWENSGAPASDGSVRSLLGQRSERSVLACAILQDRTVSCLGTNAFGQLGSAAFTDKVGRATIPNLANAEELSVSDEHACVRTVESRIFCWGNATRFPKTADRKDLQEPKLCKVDSEKTAAYQRERQANADRAAAACNYRCGLVGPVPRVPVYIEADGCIGSESVVAVATHPVELTFGAPVSALVTSYGPTSAVSTEPRLRSCVIFADNRFVCGN